MAFPQIGLEAIFKDAAFNQAITAYKTHINDAVKGTDTAAENITTAFGKIAGAMTKVAVGAVAFAGALVAGVSFALLSTVQGAGELEDQIGKTGYIFGTSAAEVEEFGKTAATSIGMSTSAALEAATTFGGLFLNLGFTQKAAKDMSISLLKLAADLGALMDIPTADVMNTLQMAMEGNYRGLRQFNIIIDESMVKQQAMKMGLIGVKDEMNNNVQAQATYALLLQQSALATGQFADSTTDLRIQQMILAAEWQNTKDKLGGALLPLETAFVTMFSSILSSMGPMLDNISTAIRNWTITAAANMFYWGADMVQSLANGMAGSSAVIDALNQIGNYFTYMLQANSPPRLLPDLTLWGSAAMNAYLEGWEEASTGTGAILDQWGKSLQPYLEKIMGGGAYTNEMGKALKEQFGYTKGTMMSEYLKTYADLNKATTSVTSTQAAYDKALATGNAKAIAIAKDKLDKATEAENQAESSYSSAQNRVYSMADAEDRKRLAIEAQTLAIQKQEEAAQKAAEAAQKAADARTASDAKQLEAAAKNLEAQELAYKMAKTDTTGKIALIDQEIAKHAEGSAEWYQLQTQKIGLEKQLQSEIAKTGAAAGSITPLVPIQQSIGKIKQGLIDIGAGLFLDPLTMSIRLPPPSLWEAVLNLGTSLGGGFLGTFIAECWKQAKIKLGIAPDADFISILAKVGTDLGTAIGTAMASAIGVEVQAAWQRFLDSLALVKGTNPGDWGYDPWKALEPTTPEKSKTGFGKKKAALGFEGIVFSPTMFTVGESGPERVSVMPLRGSEPGRSTSPAGAMGGGGGDNYWVLNITTSAPTENILNDYRMLASMGGSA